MSGKKWVLLVAGSKGWQNYRHQANVCCLYQIIKQHRIPDEQIVVMMYDDIAYNPENPNKGKIVSVIKDFSDVYAGVPKNYTGEDVTPKNFLAALQGKLVQNKQVIQSGSDDEIFIFMFGLGGQGTFAFPSQSLPKDNLFGAINTMYGEKKFSKMVIYMDSDYSATMFKDFPKFINVYAVTSCDEGNKNIPTDPDPKRHVNLSDQFSSALLTYLNTADFDTATLKSLYDFLSKFVTSNPCKFGDLKIADQTLGDFLEQ